MGFSSTQVACDSIRTRNAAAYPLEKGELRSVSAFCLNALSEPAQTYARISLVDAAAQQQKTVAILTEGYIGQSLGIHWSGRIPLSSGYSIALEAWSSASATVRLAAITDV